MPTKIHKILLILILLLGTFLRSYHLNSYPSLNPDEAALGYNAYSLLETGRDEHGASWPLHFKSFGDYKPGGYVYLAMPFVKIFGLTPLAVRLPNLILSILSLYIFYRLVFIFSKNYQLSLLATFVLSVNPWHIHFSRGAWESCTALSFILLGLFFFYQYLQNSKLKFLYFFTLFFSLSLYTYHSARIIAPLLAVSLILIYRKYIFSLKSIPPFIFGILITLPVIFSFLHGGGTARFSGVGLLSDYGPTSRAEELLNHHMNTKLFNRIIHNKRLLYSLLWVQKYLSHFEFNFLFINGDEVPRSKVPETGQFYLFEFPLLLFGIYCLIHTSVFQRHKLFILSFLLIAPLASSLTFQAPSALRSLPLVIPLTIFISLGLYELLSKCSHITCYLLLVTCYLFFISSYLSSYFIHYEKRYPFAWNYGFNQVVPLVESLKSKYTSVYFTNKYDQPYILYLFFSRYSPLKIQSQIKLTPPDRFGFSTVDQIDNIHFTQINWDTIPKNSLIIAATEIGPTLPQTTINFPNGETGFKIYIK